MKTRDAGFTLIELMVAIAIAAILIAIAAPNFSGTVKASRASSQIRELANALTYARSEAITRGSAVVICRSADGTSCGGTWANGWVMCADINNDNDCAGEASLRVFRGIGNNTMQVYHYDAGLPVLDNFVRYSHNGTLTNTNANAATFAICDVDADVKYARAVLVSAVGRTLLSNAGNGVIAKDSGGVDVTCP